VLLTRRTEAGAAVNVGYARRQALGKG